MLEEFKKFAMRGNVVDLAVGVIIGAAFGAIVNSLVGDIVMPLIGAVTGGLDFSNYFIPLSAKVTATSLAEAKKQGAVLAWGNFVTLAINFLIIAWVLFLAIKGINRLKAPEPPPAPAAPSQGSAVADRNPRPAQEPLSAEAQASWRQKPERKLRVVADNRKARFNYFIDETFEAGVALTGTEVKSLRQGKATIAESYADARGGEIWLINSNIPEYLQANRFNHTPKRPRKLLLHKRQINKLVGAVEREGMTLVPLKLYFNEKGRAKVELALARGKKLYDKRDTEKKRSWERERGRLLRQKG